MYYPGHHVLNGIQCVQLNKRNTHHFESTQERVRVQESADFVQLGQVLQSSPAKVKHPVHQVLDDHRVRALLQTENILLHYILSSKILCNNFPTCR